MIELLYDFVGIGSFYLLIKILEKYNFSKSGRSFQESFPIYSFIVCLFVMFVYLGKVDHIINTAFFKLDFLLGSNFSSLRFFIGNFLFVFLYIVFRCIKFKKLKEVLEIQQNNKFIVKIREYFYEYSDVYHMYFLKEEFVSVRIFLKWLYKVVKIFSAFIIVVMAYFIYNEKLSYQFYPLLPIIIVGELLFFFEGYTKEEYFTYIISISFRGAIDYEEMANDYRKYFKKHIIFDYREESLIKNHDLQILENSTLTQVNDSVELNTYYRYFENEKINNPVMKNYIAKLIINQSVFFNTSFYYDTMPYMFFASILKLMKSRNILVILGRDDLKDGIINWYKDGIFSICKQPELWIVDELSKQKEFGEGVGILTLSNLFETQVIEKNKIFLENVGQVIIVEPSTILLSGQIMLENLVLSLNNREEISYAIFDKNCDGIIDTLSHILKTNITEVTPIQPSNHNSIVMFWKAEDNYMHSRFFNKFSRYLGIGSELSIIALKNNVRNIKWLSNINFPVVDMKWILNQYAKLIIKFSKDKITVTDIERLDFKSDSLINNYYNDSVIIVEDEYNNCFEMARQIDSRIKRNGMVHVITADYLLRDYMIDNSSIFINDAKAIPLIVSDYTKTLKNIVLLFLIQMMSKPVLIDDIKFQLMSNNYEIETSVKDIFINILEEYFGISDDILEETIESDEKTEKRFLNIKDATYINKYLEELKIAYFLSEDEKQDENYLGARLKGHINQSFLPGQFVVLNGKYYEVMYTKKISKTNQESLIIKRAADQINKRRYYRQIREYKFKMDSWEENETLFLKKTFDDIAISQGFCDFDVETNMYLDCNSLNDICNAAKVNVTGINIRKYKKKMLLKIILPDCSDSVRITITLLLNEIFKTVYANASDYICAITKYSQEDIPEGLIHLNDIMDENNIYIVEDSVLDLGYITSVFRNLERIFGIIYDYCLWNIDYYKDKGMNYLNFGYEEMSKSISLAEVVTYLKKFGFQNNSLTQRRNYEFNDDEIRCRYCGSVVETIDDQEYEDGKVICDKCLLQDVKTLNEYKALLDYHYEKFVFSFKVNFLFNIDIKIIQKDGEERDSFSKNKYARSIIYIKNNLPKVIAISKIIYELSIIYQTTNLKKINSTLAKWSEVQYLYWIGEFYYAHYLETEYLKDADFEEMVKEYPISKHKNYNMEKTPYN